jgi:hypothetical protein
MEYFVQYRPLLSVVPYEIINACLNTISFTYFIRIPVIILDYCLFHLITILHHLLEHSNFYIFKQNNHYT